MLALFLGCCILFGVLLIIFGATTLTLISDGDLLWTIKNDWGKILIFLGCLISLGIWPVLFACGDKEYELKEPFMVSLFIDKETIEKHNLINVNEKIICYYTNKEGKTQIVELCDEFHLTFNKDTLKYYKDGIEFKEDKVKYKIYKDVRHYGVKVRDFYLDKLVYLDD